MKIYDLNGQFICKYRKNKTAHQEETAAIKKKG
jgi:hypothetical protein